MPDLKPMLVCKATQRYVHGMHPSVLLFDLDGTLVDSIPLILHATYETLKSHSLPIPEERMLVAGIGTPLEVQLADLATRLSEDKTLPHQSVLDDMHATYRTHYLAAHDAMVKPFAGAKEMLTKLKAKNIPRAIVTSKIHAGAIRTLTRCELLDFFDVIVGADDVRCGKPDPEPVHTALAQLDVTIPDASVWMIGDSPHDLAAGNAAGVHTAAVGWGPFLREDLAPHTPARWLQTMDEVVALAQL